MPTEKSKKVILNRLQLERKKLIETLAGLSGDETSHPGVVGVWSVKDVLAHLAHWEAGMLNWIKAARQGQPVDGPEEGLTWRQMHEYNQRIYEAHRNESLPEVKQYFHDSHACFMEMVEDLPDDELLIGGYYGFTGKKAVYDWLGSYAAHDRWGREAIEKWLKERK